jgi:hypothetical protein
MGDDKKKPPKKTGNIWKDLAEPIADMRAEGQLAPPVYRPVDGDEGITQGVVYTPVEREEGESTREYIFRDDKEWRKAIAKAEARGVSARREESMGLMDKAISTYSDVSRATLSGLDTMGFGLLSGANQAVSNAVRDDDRDYRAEWEEAGERRPGVRGATMAATIVNPVAGGTALLRGAGAVPALTAGLRSAPNVANLAARGVQRVAPRVAAAATRGGPLQQAAVQGTIGAGGAMAANTVAGEVDEAVGRERREVASPILAGILGVLFGAAAGRAYMLRHGDKSTIAPQLRGFEEAGGKLPNPGRGLKPPPGLPDDPSVGSVRAEQAIARAGEKADDILSTDQIKAAAAEVEDQLKTLQRLKKPAQKWQYMQDHPEVAAVIDAMGDMPLGVRPETVLKNQTSAQVADMAARRAAQLGIDAETIKLAGQVKAVQDAMAYTTKKTSVRLPYTPIPLAAVRSKQYAHPQGAQLAGDWKNRLLAQLRMTQLPIATAGKPAVDRAAETAAPVTDPLLRGARAAAAQMGLVDKEEEPRSER